MTNILNDIVAHKKEEVSALKSLVTIKHLESSLYFQSPCVSLAAYLKREDKSGIIAEFKKQSPSAGAINKYANVEEISLGYMQAGASALSILTDKKYFNGSNKDLEIARQFNYCPIIRKDFIIDEYQILEAKSIGADAILLIAAILSKAEITLFTNMAHSLNLEVLLELHDANELSKIDNSVSCIGINNRNLNTMKTDINTSYQMKALLNHDFLTVSESGISNIDTLLSLQREGFDGFLIGEYFMKHAHPVEPCQLFAHALIQNKTEKNISLAYNGN
jgi:indole-3-glycerol phosphate synthase